MAYRVFISHSTADLGLVYQLKYWLEANDIEAYVAQFAAQPGVSLSSKVIDAIQQADCVLALWTENGTRSAWVNQEIGIARQSNRLLVPIVQSGVTPSGLLSDREYIPFDPSRPEDAVTRAVSFLHAQKLNKTSSQRATATVLVALGLLALAAGSARREEEITWR